MHSPRRRWLVPATIALASHAMACGGPSPGASSKDTGKVGSIEQGLVNFGISVTPFGGPGGSETASLVNVFGQLVVTFNYDDPNHIFYPSNNRVVCPGAADQGFAYSINAAADESTVFASPQRLVPPPGIAALWGDPNIGQIKGTGYVYATTLAVPFSKLPTDCPEFPGACGPGVGCATGTMGEDTLGGACIARSTDGGQTFSVSANDCIGSSTNGVLDFYDGTAIAGMLPPFFGGQSSQAVFAAFNNVDYQRIDVWMAPTPTSGFTQLPDPFHSLAQAFQSHARLIPIADNRAYGMVVIAADETGTLWANEYFPGAGWGSPPGWPRLVATDYSRADITLQNGVTMRRGAQFEAADATNFDAPTDSLMILYAAWNNGHAILKSAACDPVFTESTCHPMMTIDPGVNVFHPGVGSAVIFTGAQPPNPNLYATWRFSWIQETGGGNVALYSGNVTSNPSLFTPRTETGTQAPCPDERPGMGGYWGDYDSQMPAYQPSDLSSALFWRSFSDSTGGACDSIMYHSSPVNVSTTWIAP